MRRAAKPKPTTPDTCRLTLTIKDVDYRVTPILSPSGRAWRLKRLDGKGQCLVVETAAGPTCDCSDAVWRHQSPGDSGCKHVRALRVLGLIGRG